MIWNAIWFLLGCVCGVMAVIAIVIYAVAALQMPHSPRPGTPRKP